MPTWRNHGPDNADPKAGSHITMIASENLNVLLKIVLKLIMKNVGNAEAEWMSRIAMISTPIIINTSEELLKDPFFPLIIKYVDLQRTHWIRNNVEEAEHIYNAAG